jgi:hypothetical protein
VSIPSFFGNVQRFAGQKLGEAQLKDKQPDSSQKELPVGLQNSAGTIGAAGLIGAPAFGYATAAKKAPEEKTLIDRAVIPGKYATQLGEQEKRVQELKDELNKRGQAGLGGMLGLAGVVAPFIRGEDYYLAAQTERAMALADAGANEFDPLLRKNYINQGPYSLITDEALNKVNTYVPPGLTGFVPADLTKAGKFNEVFETLKKDNPEIRRQITVSPGPQPRRLSYADLTEADLGKTGQKGYVWGNPDQPQFGYVIGNYNRGAQKASNPAVNLLAVDMPSEQERRFRTTGQIVSDDSFTTNRGWGERKVESGDVMFPKENILGRAEVTAADVYTKMRNLGLSPELGDFTREPAKAFRELTNSYAEAVNADPVTALQELATPVTPLGTSVRETGKLPIYQQFLLEDAAPEAVRRSGIGTVYLSDDTPVTDIRAPKDKRMFLETTTDNGWNVTRHFEVNPSLINPRSRAVDFLRRQSGAGVMTGVGLAMDPQINQALQRGDYAEAAMVGGTGVAAGVAGEAVVKRGLAEFAKRGIAAPLKIASAAAAPFSAITTATLAPGSSPQPKAIGTYRGSTVYRNPYGDLVAAPVGDKPMRLGQAVKGGKPTFVPWGSVAGTKVGPRTVGRPWWDVGQFIGR